MTFGLSNITIIASAYLFLAVVYITLMLGWLISRKHSLTNFALAIYIMQGILAPVLMSVAGIILIFQGWRLDPILQFQQFLILLLIIYLSFKDIVINIIQRMR